jgi:hypothetical protein
MQRLIPHVDVYDRSTLPLDSANLSRIRRGLTLLWQANDYLQLIGGNRWNFAVELCVLMEAGLSRNDLRLLLWQGLLDHAWEIKDSDKYERVFDRSANLHLSSSSCFLFTDKALRVLKQYRSLGEESNADELRDASFIPDVPTWDDELRKLTVGECLVKTFKLPAPNQICVLTVFQEEGWPYRIDDPLPMDQQVDPKRRLHDTIKSLNRHQKFPLLRFFGDGTGEGICWSRTSSDIPGDRRSRPCR